ncbi:MAG: hypothetical protein RRY16_01575 [Bacilli bacterium]
MEKRALALMEIVKSNLNGNSNISQEEKDNIGASIELFLTSFPDVDITPSIGLLSALKIRQASSLESQKIIKYDNKQNTAFLNKSKLEESDGKNVCMQITLNVLFSNDNKEMKALSTGITESIANTLVGGSNESDEFYLFDRLTSVLDLDSILSAYFCKDMESIHDLAQTSGIGLEFENLLDNADYNFYRPTPSIADLIVEQLSKLEQTKSFNSVTGRSI